MPVLALIEMEIIEITTYLLTIFAVIISYLLLKPIVIGGYKFCSSKKVAAENKLPPGPPALVLLANFLLHPRSFFQTGPFLTSLCKKYGPIITFRVGSTPFVFISSSSLTHQAMVKNGAIFAGRPKEVVRQLFSNEGNERKTISSSDYGETWRILRKNLTSEFLHPSRINSYAHARKRVLDGLIGSLEKHSHEHGKAFSVYEPFQYAMHSLMMLICFGDHMNEDQIRKTDKIRQQLTSSIPKLKVFSICPRLGNIVFKNRRNEFLEIIRSQDDVFTELINARSRTKSKSAYAESSCLSYVDTLLDLQLPNDKKLSIGDLTSLCSEFLIAATDTTTTAIQWVMANLVKYQHVQARLFDEIKAVVGQGAEVIKEDDLRRMPYLKAVIFETLRRHPPAYLPTIPRAATEDVELGGYVIPKKTAVNFLIADIGRDPNLWEEPMEFKPERFFDGVDYDQWKEPDVTGSKEIKFIPFGTGRRICPGSALAMSSLEYFVANLIWHFEWTAGDGKVDLTEEQDELTIVKMKSPLLVHLYPRIR